jgi:hypothetical protein
MARPKIESKALIKRLEDQKHDRKKITLFLSGALFEKFKKSCGDFSASQVMEELMREFIAGAKK